MSCNTHTHTVGSVLSGWPFAYVMESYTWNMAYWIVELASVVMVLLTLYLVVLALGSIRVKVKPKM